MNVRSRAWRQHHKDDGTPKRGYETIEDARIAAAKLYAKGFEVLPMPYRCGTCDRWHLGRTREQRRREASA